MGFWIFMLVVELFIPAIMIVLGNYFYRHTPEEINSYSGYRTSRSMKNKDTWKFANRHFARTWRALGWILAVPVLAAMFTMLGKNEDAVGNFGALLIAAQVAVLLVSIVPTELALRRTFDENGNRK